MGMPTLEKQIKDYILTECHQEKVGIACIERFNSAPKGMHPTDFLPGCQSVIMFCTRLPDGADFAKRVKDTLEDMQSSQPVDSARPVYYPGLNMMRTRQENLEKGIPVEESVWETVLKL